MLRTNIPAILRNLLTYPTSAIREFLSGYKGTIFNLKLLLIFITSLGGPCAGIAWGADYSAAISAYHAGHVQQAKGALLSEIEKATADDEKFSAANLLLDICGRTFDTICVGSTAEVLFKVADKVIHDPEGLRGYKFSLANTIFARASPQQQQSLTIDPEAYGSLEALAIANLSKFATTQLDAADFLRSRDMPTDAVLATSRALSGLLGLSNSANFDRASLIVGLIRSFVANGDTIKAIQWLRTADTFIAAQLPADGPDFALYTWLRASTIAGYSDRLVSAFPLYEDAYAKINRVDFTPAVKSHILADITADWAAALALAGNIAKASDIIQLHPATSIRNKILSGEVEPDTVSIVYATASVLIEASRGIPDERWRTFLHRGRDALQNFNYGKFISHYIDAAETFLYLKSDMTKARAAARRAAAARIAYLTRRYGELAGGFPLPDIWDQVLMLNGVIAASADHEDFDLVLKGTELLDRGYRSAMSDHLGVLSAQPNDEMRNVARTWIRLSDQRSEWELEQLRSIISEASSKGSDQAPSRIAWRRSTHSRLVREEYTNRSALSLSSFETSAFPTVFSIRAELRTDEAYFGSSLVGNQIIRYCISPQDVRWTRGFVDLRVLQTDYRTLINSLTRFGPPDNEADLQFPVDEAITVWRTITDGVEECLRGAKKLIIRLPPALTGLSVAALLSHAPPKLERGWDLRTADWIGRDWALSYVSSGQEFLASRKLAGLSGGDLPLLTIGDPALAEPDGTNFNAQVAARGVATSNPLQLRELGNLPETRTEVEQMAASFGQGSVKLLGLTATESDFRSQLLTRFKVIHFATHALTREEVPGLTEAALVLTPTNSIDSFDDGLLTIHEIASLDLRARLVILSACNTANLDPQIFGGQVQGLTSAFSVAGASTLISSLWSIDDVAAQGIMHNFADLAHMEPMQTVSGIMQMAVSKFLAEASQSAFHHPRFWAAFVVTGDGSIALGSEGKRDVLPVIASRTDTSEIGGEIISAAEGGKRIFLNKVGSFDVSSQRHSSVVEAARSDGETIWSVKNQSIAAGPILVADDLVIAGGYQGRTSFSAMIRAFKRDSGLVAWTWSDSSHGSTLLTGLARYAQQVSLEGVQFESRQIRDSRDEGNILWLAPPLRYDHQLVVPVTLSLTRNPLRRLPDRVGLPQACIGEPTTVLYFLDLETLEVARKLWFPKTVIKSVSKGTDGALVLTGSRADECELEGRGIVVKFTDAGTESILWQDKDRLRSEVVGYSEVGDRAIIVAKTRRVYAVDVKQNFSTEAFLKNMFNDANKHREIGDDLEFDEIMLASVRDGQETREYFGGGYSASPMGVIWNEHDLTIYGSIARMPLSLRLGIN
jgi:hypothetical protein